MSRIKMLFIVAGVLAVSAVAIAKTIITDEETFHRATQEACEGKSVGAECSVEFEGGSVGFGFCIEIPGPAGGHITCQLNIPELHDCNNNAMGTPGSWITFGALAGLLFLVRRRRQ